MKNFKKILTLAAVIVVTAAIAVVGTLAYLTDRESKVNTFTVGDVQIELSEVFEQGSKLTPGVDIEKTPTIKNTGDNDTYVWMTYAIPSALNGFGNASKNVIHVNHSGATWKGYENNQNYWLDGQTQAMPEDQLWLVEKYKQQEALEIGGVKYDLYTSLYNKPLKAGATTSVSMKKVYLDPHVDIDPEGNWFWIDNGTATDLNWNTNEDGAPEIYVSAYAIQTEGFTTVDEAYAAYKTQWGSNGGAETPVIAANAGELKKALGAANDDTILLDADITADTYTVNENTTVDINLQGNTLSGIVNNNGEMNVAGGKMEASYMNNFGEATFTNVEVEAGTPTEYANIGRSGSVTEYNDVDITSAGGGVAAADGAKVVFNSGSVDVSTKSTSGRYNFYAQGAGSEIVINGGSFSFSKTLNQKRAYICAVEGATVIVNGGEFGPASTRSDYNKGIKTQDGGTVIIYGGTFGFDPSEWVADGYEAVKNDSTWTVSAK